MSAPVLTLRSADPDGSDHPLLSLDESRIIEGFWTSANPEGFSNSIQYYASGATPGLLLPGERIRVPVYFVGLQGTIDPSMEMELLVREAGSTETIDWAAMKSALRPVWIDSDAWDAVYNNLVAQIGSTWGDYVQMLRDNAVYLGRLGMKVTNASELFSFQLQQALGLSVATTLAASTDAFAASPGLILSFDRTFGNSITERYQIGPFGRGWSAPWQISLEERTDGTVVVHLSADAMRIFQPDSRRAGSYFSQTGDAGVLQKVAGGAWEVTETSGQKLRFRADRTFEYVQDINDNRITATFTATRLSSLTHSSGASVAIAYNGAGRISSVKSFASVSDVIGRTTTYTYDLTNSYLMTAISPSGTITYTYDTGTNLSRKHALTSITGSTGVAQIFQYDNFGRLVSTSLASGVQQVSYSYARGAITATDATGITSKVFFDYRGLVARTEDGIGNYFLFEYNNERQLVEVIDSLGHAVDYTRCDCGRPKTITDQLGNTTRFTLGGPNNNPTALTDAKGNVTRFGYDARGNQSTTTYADASIEQAVFDTTGNAIQLINRRGQSISMTYNAAGQLTSETFPDTTSNTYTYDVRGRLATATDSHGATTFEYDTADRLTRVNYPQGRWVEYTFDAAGRRVHLADNSGSNVHYLYDSVGRLTELRDASSQVENRIVLYSYDAAGRLAREDKGNGTFTVYSYDAIGRLASIVNRAPNNNVNSRFDYGYDVLNQRTSMSTLDGGWSYSYDLTGQLTHAIFDSVNPQVLDQDLVYIYDALGNRIRTIINGVTTDYVTNNLNQYTSVGSTINTYDRDGNLVQESGPGGTRTYTYDSRSRLVQLVTPQGTWQYEYDTFGNRIATIKDGQRTEYVLDLSGMSSVVSTYNGAGSHVASYAYGFGLEASYIASSWNYYDFDALGSTVGMSGTSGNYLNTYAYDPFGATLFASTSIPNPFQFVGSFGVTAEGNGMNSMRARYYRPDLGRFSTIDPIRFNGQDANLYRYSQNDPSNAIDPSGYVSITLTIFKTLKDLAEAIQSGEGVGKILGDALNGTTCDFFDGAGSFVGGYFGGLIGAAAGGAFGVPVGVVVGTGVGSLSGPVGSIVVGIEGGVVGALAGPVIGGYVGGESGGIVGGAIGRRFCYYLWPPGGVGNAGGTAGGTAESNVPQARDPNELIGPAGFGTANYVSRTAQFPYRINFENDATATAPAQRIVVTNQLSANLDWGTFEFTGFGFGDYNLSPPFGSQHYENTVLVSVNDDLFNVEFVADLDLQTGLITVVFQSIDPGTQLPPDVLIGLLPPEDGTGRGKGYIDYVVRPKSSLTNGTEIRNIALIKFDVNDNIATNQVDPHDPSKGTDSAKEALVTIDAVAPQSSVTALPISSLSSDFTVSWAGTDGIGSGIGHYDVFVSVDSGAFQSLLQSTSQTSTFFDGQPGHSYAFYSVASDRVGNQQATPSAAQATTATSTFGIDRSGSTVNVTGGSENNVVVISFTSQTTFEITFDSVTEVFDLNPYNRIVVDAGGGNDSLTVTLSSLADTAILNGKNGSITSSGYAISYANVETTVLNGGANDQVTYNDPGGVNTAYLLPAYGILQGTGFTNQAIAFGNHTVNAAGNDDNLFIYGDTGVQAYVATPSQARMPVGSQLLIGNNFKRVYAYGMGGNDTATYSGSAADETMTALAFYTFVNTASTVQYFDSFKALTVAGNGGLDIAVMYDTTGVDTFTASDTSFRYTRSGVFNNIANGYDRVYAFNYFGGFDTATLNGSSGNDKLTSINNYSVLVTPSTLQQATGFRTVIVNAGTGTDTATLQDSPGNDTFNAFAGTAELIYGNGRTARPSASTRSTPTARSAARIVAISTLLRISSSSKGLGSRFG